MSLKAGDAAPNFDIVDTNGNKLTLADLGTQKAWLTLYRPSACPMCNLQVSRIKKRYTELTKNGMKIIQVFESTPAEMKSFAGTQVTAEFPIYVPAPDSNFQIYRDYHRQRSCMGSAMGKAFPYHMCVDGKFWPGMAKFGANPKFGCPLMNPSGFYQLMCTSRGLFTMPTDVLIEDGKVVNAFYGDTIGKHLDISIVEEFAGISGAVSGQEMTR
ncbi:hypothetical protein TrVE_jg12889 [Triparma verrucosa]|uniref:Thioredoxin domain-containing protein n=1 Tax=Triparma verrucosa TaxID=1606542 RepID=A0A9W7KTA1_9STRA|nr:hypothetical protein TrVE_jg12889 [Triparma verrucosa]